MSPRDALMYWIGDKIPNDQFLLYAFTPGAVDPKTLREKVSQRSAVIEDLCLRVRDVPWNLDYPYWVTRTFGDDQFIVHELTDPDWTRCREATAAIVASALDIRIAPWRLHVFPDVRDVPGCDGVPALVAILQVSHALADGRRAAAIARELFGPGEPGGPRPAPDPGHVGPVSLARAVMRTPFQLGQLVARSYDAFRAYKESVALTARGELPPPQPGRALTALNTAPGTRHDVRMIVLPLADLRGGHTVTVKALTAISVALSRYLAAGGSAVPETLGAEVTVASPGEAQSRNHFHNVGVDLFPHEPDLRVRAEKIARALDERRARAVHPTTLRQGRPLDVTPALLVWFGINSHDPADTPATVSGNTVVTSVHRGAADLRFAGADVRFTAGFPALSPMMGVTHGVYSIGDTMTVSVHSSPRVMPDPENYEALLREALDDIARILHEP